MTPARLLTWFLVVLALGLAGRWQAYHAGAERCALDGRTIAPSGRVELRVDEHVATAFCSIDCALAWPEPPPSGARWSVRDLVSGERLDATVACFVQEAPQVDRRPRLRAFRSWVDAQAHLTAHGGTRVPNPLPPSPEPPTSP